MIGIAEWLQKMGLEKYAPLFAEHEITIEDLPHLTESRSRPARTSYWTEAASRS